MKFVSSRIIFGVTLLCFALFLSTAKAQVPAIVVTNVPTFGTNNYGANTFLSGYVTNANFTTNCLLVFDFWWNENPSPAYDKKLTPFGWFSRPNFASPKTTINADGTWSCNMPSNFDQYATEYAVLLVPTNYTPSIVSGAWGLPYTVLAKAEVTNYVYRHDTYRRQINWAGYSWWVKTAGDDGDQFLGATGPGPNYYTDDTNNAWVDSQGQLHLAITYTNHGDGDQWYCVELFSDESFGYGQYRCTVSTTNMANLDINANFALFTWSDDTNYADREIDMEVSYWDGAYGTTTNEDYAVAPYNNKQVLRLAIPGTVTNATHSFIWSPTNVAFQTLNGNYSPSPASSNIIESWTCTTSPIPPEGGENASLILWLVSGNSPANGQPIHVVVSSFQFDPWPLPAAQLSQPQQLSSGNSRFNIQVTPQSHVEILSTSNLLAWPTNGPILRITNQANVFPSYPLPPVTLQYTDTSPPSASASFYKVVTEP